MPDVQMSLPERMHSGLGKSTEEKGSRYLAGYNNMKSDVLKYDALLYPEVSFA